MPPTYGYLNIIQAREADPDGAKGSLEAFIMFKGLIDTSGNGAGKNLQDIRSGILDMDSIMGAKSAADRVIAAAPSITHYVVGATLADLKTARDTFFADPVNDILWVCSDTTYWDGTQHVSVIRLSPGTF